MYLVVGLPVHDIDQMYNALLEDVEEQVALVARGDLPPNASGERDVLRWVGRPGLGHLREQRKARFDGIHEAARAFQVVLCNLNGDLLEAVLRRETTADRVLQFPSRVAFLARALSPSKNSGST